MSGIKGWERAVPIKRPDNLCATNFNQKPFIPSYDKAEKANENSEEYCSGYDSTCEQYCKPDMNLMVSMEYRRIWFEERTAWQIEAYPKMKKESAVKTLEDKWRDKLKEKAKGKKGKENNGSDKKKPCKNKYRNILSKTDSGRGYQPSPPIGYFPCKPKESGVAPAEGSSTRQEEVKLELQDLGSLTSQGSRNLTREGQIVQEKESFMSHEDGTLEQQSTEELPCPKPRGNELVAKCPRCDTFHPLREKCPAIVLCKEQAFRERIMRNMC